MWRKLWVAKQESQFMDFLDHHVILLSDIRHDSSQKI